MYTYTNDAGRMPTALAPRYGQKSTAVSPKRKLMATYGENGESLASNTICAPSRITAWSSDANREPSRIKNFSTIGLAAYRAMTKETPAPIAHEVETSATPRGVP
jgi:hypothetical protein